MIRKISSILISGSLILTAPGFSVYEILAAGMARGAQGGSVHRAAPVPVLVAPRGAVRPGDASWEAVSPAVFSPAFVDPALLWRPEGITAQGGSFHPERISAIEEAVRAVLRAPAAGAVRAATEVLQRAVSKDREETRTAPAARVVAAQRRIWEKAGEPGELSEGFPVASFAGSASDEGGESAPPAGGGDVPAAPPSGGSDDGSSRRPPDGAAQESPGSPAEFWFNFSGQQDYQRLETDKNVLVEVPSEYFKKVYDAVRQARKEKSERPLARIRVKVGGRIISLGKARITSAQLKSLERLSLKDLKGEMGLARFEEVSAQLERELPKASRKERLRRVQQVLSEEMVRSLRERERQNVTSKTTVYVFRFERLTSDRKGWAEDSATKPLPVRSPASSAAKKRGEEIPYLVFGDEEEGRLTDNKNPLSGTIRWLHNRKVKGFWGKVEPGKLAHLVVGPKSDRRKLFTTVIQSVEIVKIDELHAGMLYGLGIFSADDLKRWGKDPKGLREKVVERLRQKYPNKQDKISGESKIVVVRFLGVNVAKSALEGRQGEGVVTPPELTSPSIKKRGFTGEWDFDKHRPFALLLHLDSLNLRGSRLASEVVERIQKLQESNVVVVLITSRPYSYLQEALLDHLKKASVRNPLVLAASNGRQIRYFSSKNPQELKDRDAKIRELRDIKGIPEAHFGVFQEVAEKVFEKMGLPRLERYQDAYLYGGALPENVDPKAFRKNYEAELAARGLGGLYDVLVESPMEDIAGPQFLIVPSLDDAAYRVLKAFKRQFKFVHPDTVDPDNPEKITDYRRVVFVGTYSEKFDQILRNELGEVAQDHPFSWETVANQAQYLTVHNIDEKYALKTQQDLLAILDGILGKPMESEYVDASTLRSYFYWQQAKERGYERGTYSGETHGIMALYLGVVVNGFIEKLAKNLKSGAQQNLRMTSVLRWLRNAWFAPWRSGIFISPVLQAARKKPWFKAATPGMLRVAEDFVERFIWDNFLSDNKNSVLPNKVDAMRNLSSVRGYTRILLPAKSFNKDWEIGMKLAMLEFIPDADGGKSARGRFFKTGREPNLEGMRKDPYFPLGSLAILAGYADYKDQDGIKTDWVRLLKAGKPLDGTFYVDAGERPLRHTQIVGDYMTRSLEMTFEPKALIQEYRSFLVSLAEAYRNDLEYQEMEQNFRQLEEKLAAEFKAQKEKRKKEAAEERDKKKPKRNTRTAGRR